MQLVVIKYSCSRAGVAQLVEQLIRNQQVAGSSPAISSKKGSTSSDLFYCITLFCRRQFPLVFL